MGIRPSLKIMIGVDDLKTDPSDRFKITDPRAKRFADYISNGHWEKLAETEVQERSTDFLHNRRYDENGQLDQDFMEITDRLECIKEYRDGKPERATYADMFCWHPEYGLPNVVGVHLPCYATINKTDLYDDLFLWFLSEAGIFPSGQSKVYVISETPFCETRSGKLLSLALLKGISFDKIPGRERYILEHGRLFRHFGADLTNDFEVAWLILNRCGFDFNIEELRLMLYWMWS